MYICDPLWEKVPLGQKIKNRVSGITLKRAASAIHCRKPRLHSAFLRRVISRSVVALDYPYNRENAH